MPPESLSAVSSDSDRRCAASARMRNLSTTTSMVCFFFASIFGSASSSCTRPSMRTRTKPWPRSCSKTSACSPLRSMTIGASSRIGEAFRQLHDLVDHLAHGLRREIDAVIRAARDAGAREQQA